MLKELFGIDAFVLRIRVGEMVANVAHSQSTQQRVANHMQQDICIAVAHGPVCVRDLNASEPEGFPFCQLVNIVTVTNPKGHRISLRLRWIEPNLRTATAA